MEQPTQRGRADINEVLAHLKSKLGKIPLDESVQQSRNNCKLLLDYFAREYPDLPSVALANRLIDIAFEDAWTAQRANSMRFIYWNKGKLIAASLAKKPQEPQGPYKIV